MASNTTYCSYKDCGALIFIPGSYSCPRCTEVPNDGDIHGEGSNYNYCCHHHMVYDETLHRAVCLQRQLMRTVVRIAMLCEVMYVASRMQLFFFDILESSVLGLGPGALRRVVTAPSYGFRTGRSWWPYGLSWADIMAAVSFDDSVDATAFCTPLLAWLVGYLPVHVEEINAIPAKQLQTYAVLRYPNGSFERHAAKWNTFIALTPIASPTAPADGIVLDNTAMQFGNPAGAHTKSQYFHRYVDLIEPCHSAPLGNSFGYHCTQLKTPGCANKNVLALAMGMRLSNEIIYDRVSQLGGPGALFSMSHVAFIHELECIKGLLHGGLQELRLHIDHVFSTHTHPFSTLAAMVDDHAGLGHKVMMDAFYKYNP